MNNMTDNEGLTNPANYQVDVTVQQLDRNGATLKTYILRGAFPTSLSRYCIYLLVITILLKHLHCAL